MALLIGASAVVAYTLAPFGFSVGRAELLSRARHALDVTSTGGWLKSAAHLVVFLALGVLIAAVYESTLATSGFLCLAAGAVLACAVLELAQLFQASRHARVTDLLCNSVGLLLGLRTATWPAAVRTRRATAQQWVGRYSHRFAAALLALAIVGWSVSELQPVLEGWGLGWDDRSRHVIARALESLRLGANPWAHVASAVLLVVAVSLPAFALLRRVARRATRHLFVVAITFSVAVAPSTIAWMLVDEPLRAAVFTWLAGALLSVYPITLRYTRPCARKAIDD